MKIEIPWDLNIELIKLFVKSIQISEKIEASTEVTVTTPTGSYTINID
ncbi:hypothetical protein [Paenibacillus odorifer]|jgi:hypothetical protein|nr:hypothetical protein [Paenibacillus odorifer]